MNSRIKTAREHVFYLVGVVLVFIIYFLTAKFGLRMDAVGGFAALVWPPTGISLAVLLLYGYRFWPGIFLGAFTVNFVTGASFLVASGIGIGNSLEAFIGACLLQRFADFHKPIDRIKDVFSFLILACLISTLVSATVGVTCLWLGGITPLEHVGATWSAWWTGDILGDLVVAPLILVYGTSMKSRFDLWQILEGTLLVASLIATGFAIFHHESRIAYWFFPFMAWGALRFGQIGNVTVTFLISTIAVWAITLGLGPFSHGPIRDNLLFLNGFMAVITTTGMMLAAALAERRLAIQARDEFLSIASHELKTPLTSLTLQIQMAKQKINTESNTAPSREMLAKAFDVSERQVRRLTGLVEELLDVSRIQTGKFSFNFEKTNLSDLVKEMTERFSTQLKKAQCDLETNIETNIIGRFDHARMEQVIDNLLSNVVKYAPGKPVKVLLSRHDKMIRLVVEDRGPGIPLERQPKIFERFERASDSTDVSGLGLGLFIVKEIVKGHDGSIHVESGGSGSKFVIELPLRN